MLSYIGGKSRISSFIKQYIPNDIETYAEPFSGMFWVYFKMELSNYPHLKNIIYNDFNPLNANLFNCVRDSIVFANMINGVESQQESLFYKYQSEIFHPDFKVDLSNPDYDAAIKYAYVLSQVWSGTNPERAKFIDLKGKYTSKFDSFKNKLNSLIELGLLYHGEIKEKKSWGKVYVLNPHLTRKGRILKGYLKVIFNDIF